MTKQKSNSPKFILNTEWCSRKKPPKRMLEHKPWDHAIDLKPNFIPKDCKVYPLSPEEQKEQDKFLEETSEKSISDPQNY